MLVQVALAAGSVYTCIEIFAGVLFVATRDKNGSGYYPSNLMVCALCTSSAHLHKVTAGPV